MRDIEVSRGERLDSNQLLFLRVWSIRMDETRAHARSRTGSHRVRGGCSTIEKHGHERTRVYACGELARRERSVLRRIFARVEKPLFLLVGQTSVLPLDDRRVRGEVGVEPTISRCV